MKLVLFCWDRPGDEGSVNLQLVDAASGHGVTKVGPFTWYSLLQRPPSPIPDLLADNFSRLTLLAESEP
jgi:hypothetical protein